MTLYSVTIILSVISLAAVIYLITRLQANHRLLKELLQTNHQQQTDWQQWLGRQEARATSEHELRSDLLKLMREMQSEQAQQRQKFDEYQIKSLKLLQESLSLGMQDIRQQVTQTLQQNSENIGKRVDKLTEDTNKRLQEISGQVEKRLTDGFDKTSAIFQDVIKRLALIDQAQQKITELSGNVVSLQEVLADKRSRGAFGEVQLTALLRNVMPEQSIAFQHNLSNGKRVDCMLFLPEPTGNIAIDAKFPLETYRKLTDIKLSDIERKQAEQQFRADIKHHIQSIAEKYIIADETADGAIMFIPAEAVFAEIHAHYPELIELAQAQHVWLVSPTTMMAILTTARAVIKDAATRKQVHVIQEHLALLGKDFSRFQQRMDMLAKHIQQAHDDVEKVHKSSKKITNRFNKIEQVELEEDDQHLAISHDEQ